MSTTPLNRVRLAQTGRTGKPRRHDSPGDTAREALARPTAARYTGRQAPPPIPREPDGDPVALATPFLIVGAGRGGTTLLAACLAAHPEIHVDMERFGTDVLMGLDGRSPCDGGLLADRAGRFRQACLAAAADHPGLWGNKITTEHILGLDQVNAVHLPYTDVAAYFFEHAVGDFPIVFILRDGRACIPSKVARTGQPEAFAAHKWRFSVSAWRALTRVHANAHVIRFEDLVRTPAACLRDVCAFLGRAFDPAMLAAPDSTAMPADYRRAGFDPAALANGEIAAVTRRFIADDLGELGYTRRGVRARLVRRRA